MKEAYIIQIDGINWLIEANCFAEAKIKSKKLKGIIKSEYNQEDYNIVKQLNQSLK